MIRRTLLAALLLGASVVAAVPAGADAPAEYGYWTKAQSPTSPNPSVPVPPTIPVAPPEEVVPEGGLYVALAATTTSPDPSQPPSPAEPAAVSALRFFVEPGSEVELTLGLAEGYDADGPNQQNTPAQQVDACIVAFGSIPWDAPEGPGRWDDRPEWDCDSVSVTAELEEDGQRLRWNLGSAFEAEEGVIDVVLVPKGVQDPNDPNNVQPVPFQMAFDPPDDGTLFIVSSPAVDDDGGGGGLDEDFGFEGFGSEEGFGDEFAFDDTGGTAFDGGESGTNAPTGRVGNGTRTFRPIAQAPLPLDNRFDRILAVSLLFLMGFALWWLGGVETRPPRLLGSLGSGSAPVSAGDTRLGGVGRFARARSGRPPRL